MAVLFTIKKGIVPAITCRNRPSICTNTRSSFDPTRNQGETPVVDYLWDDSGFSGNLAVGDDTFQKVFDKVDGLSGVGGGTNDYNDLDNKPNLDFLPLSGGTLTGNIQLGRTGEEDSSSLLLDNGSSLHKGTDNRGGNGGIELECSINYKFRWEAGQLWILYQDNTVRAIEYAFQTPGANDDITQGFVVSSKWTDNDDNTYVCTDNTEGAAVWELVSSKLSDLVLAVTGDDVALTTGNGKLTFRMPYAMTLTSVRANVKTASSGVIIVDINQNGSSILSTKLSIDANEKTSITAETPAVISTIDLIDDAEITIDIDQIGISTAGSGLKVVLKGIRV